MKNKKKNATGNWAVGGLWRKYTYGHGQAIDAAAQLAVVQVGSLREGYSAVEG